MLFWGTILSSTLRAGPSTSEVKRHKVLSTSKSLALFCSGLVILLANEASEAIRHEYRVPGGARAAPPRLRARAAVASSQAAAAVRRSPATLIRRRTSPASLQRAETTCAAAASSQAARRRRRRGAGDAHAASHIRSATFGKQLQYLLQKQQPTSAAPHT